jgi:hypothetical protein
VFPKFKGAAYAARYEELCRRLASGRPYTAATLLLSKPEEATVRPSYREAAEDLSMSRICNQLSRSVNSL